MSYNEQLCQATARSMPPYIQIAGIETKTKSKRPSLKLKLAATTKEQKDDAIITFGCKVLFFDTYEWKYLGRPIRF